MGTVLNSIIAGKRFYIQYPKLDIQSHNFWFANNFKHNAHFGRQLVVNLGGRICVNNAFADSVLWVEKAVSVANVSGNLDILSFNFSGCIMACFKYNGRQYAAHIHMPECKQAWVNYFTPLLPHVSDLRMFRPHYRLPQNTLDYLFRRFLDVQIVGLISTALVCYTVIIGCESENDNNSWHVISLYQHQAPESIVGYNNVNTHNGADIDIVWNEFFDNMTYRKIDIDRNRICRI